MGSPVWESLNGSLEAKQMSSFRVYVTRSMGLDFNMEDNGTNQESDKVTMTTS